MLGGISHPIGITEWHSSCDTISDFTNFAAVSIGVVIHSDCLLAGHGPGITVLMTSAKPLIAPVIDDGANLADLLKIGRKR